VLKERVGGEDAVVRLDNSGGDLGRRIDSEGELGLAAVVDREALEEQGTKLVWNSEISTLRAPSKRREAVREDTT